MSDYLAWREKFIILDTPYLKVIINPTFFNQSELLESFGLSKEVFQDILVKKVPIPQQIEKGHYLTFDMVYGKPESWTPPVLGLTKEQRKIVSLNAKMPKGYKSNVNKVVKPITCTQCGKQKWGRKNKTIFKIL